MKIVFKIEGEIEGLNSTVGSLNDLSDVINTLRGFASADGKFKVVTDEDEWQEIEV